MKTTIQAVLYDVPKAQQEILDKMMLIFCTAIRYSFKRLLEGNKISDLEKIVAYKYHLNIRQAKDAVESARQTILSQQKLVKKNFEDYSNKVAVIKKTLGDKDKKLSEKKRRGLLSKLEKRFSHWRRLSS